MSVLQLPRPQPAQHAHPRSRPSTSPVIAAAAAAQDDPHASTDCSSSNGIVYSKRRNTLKDFQRAAAAAGVSLKTGRGQHSRSSSASRVKSVGPKRRGRPPKSPTTGPTDTTAGSNSTGPAAASSSSESSPVQGQTNEPDANATSSSSSSSGLKQQSSAATSMQHSTPSDIPTPGPTAAVEKPISCQTNPPTTTNSSNSSSRSRSRNSGGVDGTSRRRQRQARALQPAGVALSAARPVAAVAAEAPPADPHQAAGSSSSNPGGRSDSSNGSGSSPHARRRQRQTKRGQEAVAAGQAGQDATIQQQQQQQQAVGLDHGPDSTSQNPAADTPYSSGTSATQAASNNAVDSLPPHSSNSTGSSSGSSDSSSGSSDSSGGSGGSGGSSSRIEWHMRQLWYVSGSISDALQQQREKLEQNFALAAAPDNPLSALPTAMDSLDDSSSSNSSSGEGDSAQNKHREGLLHPDLDSGWGGVGLGLGPPHRDGAEGLGVGVGMVPEHAARWMAYLHSYTAPKVAQQQQQQQQRDEETELQGNVTAEADAALGASSATAAAAAAAGPIEEDEASEESDEGVTSHSASHEPDAHTPLVTSRDVINGRAPAPSSSSSEAPPPVEPSPMEPPLMHPELSETAASWDAFTRQHAKLQELTQVRSLYGGGGISWTVPEQGCKWAGCVACGLYG